MKPLIFFLLAILNLQLTSCKTPMTCTQIPTKKNLRGHYYQNTAKGWTRPRPDMEVIPEIPRYQYLALKRFKQFTFKPYEDTNIVWKGKWKIINDTLQLTFKKSSYTERYIIKSNGSKKFLLSLSKKGDGFARLGTVKEKRVQTSIYCHNNGAIKSYGKLKKYPKGKRKILMRYGKWRFYNKKGKIIKVICYRKGKAVWEKSDI